jgi:hypothetical protein
MTLQDYISEAISTGKHRKSYSEPLAIAGKSSWKDITGMLSNSPYYSLGWANEEELVLRHFDTDKRKPLGDNYIDALVHEWIDVTKSAVTGNRRIFVFLNRDMCVVLDFSETDNLEDISSFSPVEPSIPRFAPYNTEYLLRLMSEKLTKW